MIRNSAESDTPRKQEGCAEDEKKAKGSYSLKAWTGFKDPRVVRVSRSFGGKDRHSKVRTIKGLRDRRVRLSVSTAIQLYDLQDRLGLNQPSKVVDWLIKAVQHEIDKLPPLPIPQEYDFSFQASISNSDLEGDRYSGVQSLSLLSNKSSTMEGAASTDPDEKSIAKLQFDSQDMALRTDQFGSEKEMTNQEKSSSCKRYEQGSQSSPHVVQDSQIVNPFHLPHQPSYTSLLINALPSNPYIQRDSSHFLPHLGAQAHTLQAHENNGCSNHSVISSLSLSSGSHQLLYQPLHAQSSSPSFVTPTLELDHSRQLSHTQLLNMSMQSSQPTSPSSPFGNLCQSFRHAYGAITSNLYHYQQNISHSPDASEKGKNV